jgi:hypothetical protein
MLGKKHIYKLLWLLLLSGVVDADIEGVFDSKAAQGFELAKNIVLDAMSLVTTIA